MTPLDPEERLRFAYSNPQAEQAIRDAHDPATLSQALAQLNDLIPGFMQPPIYGRRLHSFGLDAAVPLIAERLNLQDVPLHKSNDNVVVLATRFYRTGGHTQVADDVMRAFGAERTTLIYTDIFGEFRYPARVTDRGATRHPCRAWMILSAPSLTEKIVELYMLLAAIKPTRIVLLGNHMDMVAVAGAWPFRSVVDFIHHADYQPSLGATLPFSAHVDLTLTCHLACREAGLDPIYASMKAVAPEAAPSPPVAVGRSGPLIATCGHLHKYRKPGRHGWTDFAVAALQVPGARMIHIGPTDEAFREEVHGALRRAGLDPGRYEFGGVAPLWSELAARDVDLYLSSYPEPGSRANLEAMMAGLPCISAVTPENGLLIVERFPLPQFLPIRDPTELAPLIARAAELKAAARSPEALRAIEVEVSRFDDYLAGRPLAPVPAERLPRD